MSNTTTVPSINESIDRIYDTIAAVSKLGEYFTDDEIAAFADAVENWVTDNLDAPE